MPTTPRADSVHTNKNDDLTLKLTSPDNMNYGPSPAQVQWRKNKRELQRAAMDGDWKLAEEIFYRYPNLMTERLYFEGMTALLSAAKCGKSEFVQKLVNSLEKEQLSQMRDQVGRNVLHHAAMACDVSAAQAIVEKNRDLAQAKDLFHFTPMFYAARWRHPLKSKEMLEYLYQETDPKVHKDPETAPSLIVAITASGCHDIALRILKRHPELVLARNVDNWSILHILATQPSLFSSGRENSLLSSWVNFKDTKQKRKSYKDARELVDFVCQQLQSFENEVVMDYFFPGGFRAILHLATERGASELVECCLQYFPHLVWCTSSRDKRLLLHVAVEHRRIELYNSMMRLVGENAGSYAGAKVENNNNILHLAANLAPTPQLHSVPGPAFQMQREFQWFKAVESFVYTVERDEKNSNGLTPEELFFQNHGDLIKDAREWMKDTSNSCMVVAALVATVAFASMITVPGGINNDTRMTILSKQKVFVVFSVVNALSMISSVIAILMFLSIQLQTSKDTYKDFLESLPKNLVRGLLALFVAVTTMMIAFGTAIGLALETISIKWVYIPITVVACIPAIIFTWLHLPLLIPNLTVRSRRVIYGHQTS